MDYTTYKKVYTVGDMLHKSLFEYRKQQKEQIEGIEGLTVYNPSSNDKINSKQTADSNKLAERIVEHDTVAIEEADIYVIDLPTADAGGRGSVAEVGQIFQMKRDAQNIIDIIDANPLYQDNENFKVIQELYRKAKKTVSKVCLIYSDDVRWNTSDMNDDMDRVPYSFNAYNYGQVLALTEGVGVISWESVLEQLEELGNEE